MIETKGLTGAEAFLGVLAGMGVERIFASPGSEWAPVWEALAKPEGQREGWPRYLSSRHEEAAAGMARGYAMASGKLPAVMIHTTVGALHASMALRAALHEHIPMVVFAGESIGFGENEGPDPGGQWLRHLGDMGGPARFVERCVKWSLGVNNKALLPATIQRACQLAMAAPRGPVFVSIPMELLFESMINDAPSSAAVPAPPAADPDGIEELAGLLAKADNPVIITEESGRSVKTIDTLVQIAELVGAPVVETRSSTFGNFPRTHPLHGGFDPKEYWPEADLVFLLSAIQPWHPASAGPAQGTKIAVLDEEPLHAGLPYWGYAFDLCLAGDLEVSLDQLLERLKKQIVPGDAGRAARVRNLSARSAARREEWKKEALALGGKQPIDTRWAMSELGRVLPKDAMVVEETITHRLAVHRYLDGLAPGSFFAGCLGGLGTGLGTALGVKAAFPARPVVAVIGDGSFNYNPVLAALGYSQEYAAPVLIVLLNNHGYLSMKAPVARYFPGGAAAKSKTVVGTSIAPTPDYAAIARAFGGHGETVERPEDVAPAYERGLRAVAGGQLALIEVRLEPVNG